jgi:hypothetical protein
MPHQSRAPAHHHNLVPNPDIRFTSVTVAVFWLAERVSGTVPPRAGGAIRFRAVSEAQIFIYPSPMKLLLKWGVANERDCQLDQ